jgi:hypothetical protein
VEKIPTDENMTTVKDIAFGFLFDYGTPTVAGTNSEVWFDDDFLYVYVTDEWKRIPLEDT